jgi:hypothetical protein
MPPKNPKSFDEVPRTTASWETAAKKAGIANRSIHSFTPMKSGSKITQTQYLLLRVLWPVQRKFRKTDLAKYDLDAYIHQASNFLNGFPPFANFIDSIRQSAETSPYQTGDRFDLQIFEIARSEQLKICKIQTSVGSQNVVVQPLPPTRTRQAATRPTLAQISALNIPRSIDEDTVNTSLVSYLAALTLKLPNVGSQWMPRRLALKSKFGNDEYEARNDGFLAFKSTGKVQAIIEVKAGDRRDVSPEVQMQESAEMIAWIMDHNHRPANSPGRYVHISIICFIHALSALEIN